MKETLTLTPTFIKNIQATFGETGKRWLSNLPNHLTYLSEAWNFQLLHPMPELSYGFVAVVRLNETHQTAILKTAPETSNLLTETKWLQSIKHGVPKVYHLDETRHAFLMEHIEPGTPLKSLVIQGHDEEATRIICHAILALQSEPLKIFEISTPQPAQASSHSKPITFKHVTELSRALPLLKGHLEEAMISKAISLFQELSVNRQNDVLLHGDLHHDNILQSSNNWKVIDPHGYIGDPAAEVGTMIRNPFDCFPKDKPLKKVLDRRLKILAEMLPFDAKRINAWAFCFTMLSAAWDVEGFNEVTSNTAEVGAALYKLNKA